MLQSNSNHQFDYKVWCLLSRLLQLQTPDANMASTSKAENELTYTSNFNLGNLKNIKHIDDDFDDDDYQEHYFDDDEDENQNSEQETADENFDEKEEYTVHPEDTTKEKSVRVHKNDADSVSYNNSTPDIELLDPPEDDA